MKKTVLAVVALVALSGAAFAGETTRTGAAPGSCIETTLKDKVDCAATGSIESTHPIRKTGKADTKAPRLGIDVSPWILPTTF